MKNEITNETLPSPETFDLVCPDKHDLQNFNETVMDFAYAGGAYVYPVFPDAGFPESSILVVSPRALEPNERVEIYQKEQLEAVREEMEGCGGSPADFLAGYAQSVGGRIVHRRYFVSVEDLDRIAAELGRLSIPSPVPAVST